MGNTFSNVISCEAISGNITATISDHLYQFWCAPNVVSNLLRNKSNILSIFHGKFSTGELKSPNNIKKKDLLTERHFVKVSFTSVSLVYLPQEILI